MVASEQRISEVVNHFFENGEDKTCEVFGITHETLARYIRDYKDVDDGRIESSL